MKKKLFLAIVALVGMASTAKADVEINATNFPDEKFRNWLTYTDYGSDGVITTNELTNVRSLSLANQGIKDLTGIGYFTSLQSLSCENNLLTSLDVSQCVALTGLYCSGNQLTEIVLPNNQILQKLECPLNNLTNSLDVSRYVELTRLNCRGNQLTEIVLPDNSILQNLYCQENNLSTLDVSQSAELKELNCANNPLLAELDVAANTNLGKLNCAECALTSLDVTSNSLLTHLSCQKNQIASIDLSANPALASLNISYNALASLDVSHNTALTYLDCRYNRLTALDLSHNTALPATVSCYQYRDGENSLEGVRYNGKLAIKVAPGFDVSRVQGTIELQYYFVERGSVRIAATISDFTLVGDLLVLDYASADYLAYCEQEGCVGRIEYKYDTGHSDNMMEVDLPVYEWKTRQYDLWVNGTQVTSENCEDIEHLTRYDQSCMSYDEMANTLTLDNVYIGSTAAFGIKNSVPGLTIKLIGESTLNMSNGSGLITYFDTTITGSGSLTMNVGAGNGITIYNGTLTVTGGAQVYANASEATAQETLTIQKGCGISGRMSVKPLGTTTRTTYYGSLNVKGNGTVVKAIGSLMSVGPLKALTYPTAATLTVLNAANNEVTGYFEDNAVCLRSGRTPFDYEYTPTSFLVTITGPTCQVGDVNEDGTRSLADVTMLANIVQGTTTIYSESLADVDGNGVVEMADVDALVSIILGK